MKGGGDTEFKQNSQKDNMESIWKSDLPILNNTFHGSSFGDVQAKRKQGIPSYFFTYSTQYSRIYYCLFQFGGYVFKSIYGKFYLERKL